MLTRWHALRRAGSKLQSNKTLVSLESCMATSQPQTRMPAHQRNSLLLCFLGLHRSMSALPVLETSYPSRGGRQDREVPVYSFDRQVVGKHTLPGNVFDVPVRIDILHRVVRWQLAKRQQGTHKVKTRAEVSGGGRKPWQQKGSGRARAGSIRAPQFRGGGIAHGPVVRSHAHKLNKKVRRLGVLCALSAKAREGRLLLMDSMHLSHPKTKQLDEALSTLLQRPARRSVLMVDTSKSGADGGEGIRRAASNLPLVDLLPATGLNVYSILQRQQLVMTTQAVDLAVDRLTQPINKRLPAGIASSGLPITNGSQGQSRPDVAAKLTN